MTRNQSVRGQRWTCFAHYSNVLFDSCIDLWLRYQKKKEDTAAAKMVGEDVGEDRLHSVDLLLELMPHSYAVHSDWCKVIMVLAFSEVHFFYHCNPFLRSQEAEEAADAAGQKLHRRRQQKSLAPSAWKVERLEWWSFIITPSIMKARRQRAINRSITTLYRRRKAFFWAARKRQFWHDGGWTRYLMVGAPHRNSKSEPHQPRQPVLHETTAVCYSHFLCSVVLRDDSIICWLWLTCGKMIKLIRPSEAEEERLRAKVGILYWSWTETLNNLEALMSVRMRRWCQRSTSVCCRKLNMRKPKRRKQQRGPLRRYDIYIAPLPTCESAASSPR